MGLQGFGTCLRSAIAGTLFRARGPLQSVCDVYVVVLLAERVAVSQPFIRKPYLLALSI